MNYINYFDVIFVNVKKNGEQGRKTSQIPNLCSQNK